MFTSVASKASEASPNSWGVGGCCKLGAILDGSGETFRGVEFSDKVGKNRKFLEES